ncbi:HEPN domain-containing protein [Arthrobacter sp. zg-Y877]|uniref:HEPN domain-containing protein n=1 Tax=Arthrobacter sp. zg-Y877 TaxID=3049074 RepID=UPI0025A35368|nr:HEPN domain-containing protein [Arthrobacter sp. zg-Y877]MDM7989792.1 HEPN domain-containing protein [Arthrobacter sp. zg-Y877]
MTGTDTDLIRPDLWNLLLPGLKAAIRAGQDRMNSGSYYPRQKERKFDANSAGWPATTQDAFSFDSSGPIDWKALFGLKEGPFTHILVSHVPDLATSIEAISTLAMGDDELKHALSPVAALMQKSSAEEIKEEIQYGVLRLLGTILNRAHATDSETDEELVAIYLPLERGRFAAELSGDVVVPLLAVSFAADKPLHLADDIWLEPLTEIDHVLRAMDWAGHGPADPYVAAAATHAIVFRSVRFSNQVHEFTRGGELPPGISVEFVNAVTEAVHIVAESQTGYAQVLVRPLDWASTWVQDLPPLWIAWTGRAYPENLNNRTWAREKVAISAESTDEILRIARGLSAAPRNVQIAARRLRRTGFRDDAEDMLLDAAIGIEALVGSEADALTHRMAQRAAVALADEMPPENTYSLLKQFYSIRSKIAHGETPKRWTCKLGDHEWSAVFIGTFLLRSLLKNRLVAEDPWDAASLDQRILDSFGRAGGYASSDSQS